jgi:hypothetical protein
VAPGNAHGLSEFARVDVIRPSGQSGGIGFSTSLYLKGTVMKASTEWREVTEDDEAARFAAFAEELVSKQKALAAGSTVARAFHAKTHVGVVARFDVLEDLPPHARFGLFEHARTFDAVVRFSNGEPRLNSDSHPEPRGIAIKVLGVEGVKVAGHDGALTQDFLATSHSVTSTVRDARQFMAFIRASEPRLLLPLRLAVAVGLGESLRILGALRRTVVQSNVQSMATEHYAGTAPICCGPYAIKFTVKPAADTRPATPPDPASADFLRDDLARRLREDDLEYDVVAQFFVREDLTPIEDTSIVWSEEAAPTVALARLRIPACDLGDEAVKADSARIAELSFSPWHSLEAHRPLGSIMRARRVAYPQSASTRASRPEPSRLPLS